MKKSRKKQQNTQAQKKIRSRGHVEIVNSTRKKSSEYDHLYLPADEYVVFHEDVEGLDVIKIKLPKPPPIQKIDGYGRHPLQQKFRHTELPPKLEALNAKNYLDVEDFWIEMEQDFEYYESELWFIEREWERRRIGYWCFIKGKPTWIPPWHYMYLNYYGFVNEIDGSKHPEYRDRDRKLFVGRWYAATTTEAPFKFKYWKEGEKVRFTSSETTVRKYQQKGWSAEDKGYMVDMKSRTVMGTVEYKCRRSGYTSQCTNQGIEITTRMNKSLFGLQSMTQDKAEELFEKQIVNGYKGYPFFFKPISENIVDPKKSMNFKPALKKTGTGDNKKRKIVKALYSEMTYGSSTVGYFDGSKIKYWLSDEYAKSLEVDVLERTLVVRKAMSTGNNTMIHGYSNQISTAGDLKTGGGGNARKLAKLSHWGKRNDNGQTATGFICLFIPSDEGLEGFIDEWGFSKKEEARESILNVWKGFEDAQDWVSLNEEMRQTPLEWKHNFITNSKNARFNIHILGNQVAFLSTTEAQLWVRGRFAWKNAKGHGYDIKKLPTRQDFISKKDEIIFIPEVDDDYSWEISWMPDKPNQNKFTYNAEENKIIPGNVNKATHGIDTFKYREKTTSGSGSLGGGAIFRMFDPLVDSPYVDARAINQITGDFNHVTDRFCGTYLKRPSLNEFCEQQLMAALFFGIKSYMETNVTDVYRWYKERGFEDYMFFPYDIKKDEESKVAGSDTTPKIINAIFNAWADHIDKNGMREVHMQPLEQCLEIDDSMNDYDLFTAGGYALLQAGDRKIIEVEENNTFDASQIFEFETIE